MTAPGAMNRNPVNATIAIPSFNPPGSTLNSAQQPYFFATNLCPISCKRKAGPTAIHITGIDNSNMATHELNPPWTCKPKKPPTLSNPSAKVNAAVAKNRWCFSSSLKCHNFPLWSSTGCRLLIPRKPPLVSKCIVPFGAVCA